MTAAQTITKTLMAFTLFAGGSLRAETVRVSMDTHLLKTSANGPFSIGFQLAGGGSFGDGNNSVTLGNFRFGGGSPAGPPTLGGTALGDVSTSVTLTDASQ